MARGKVEMLERGPALRPQTEHVETEAQHRHIILPRWVMAGPGVPKRRISTHVETLHGELCIYEWRTKTVHALNPAAARVSELCDGVTTVDPRIVPMWRIGHTTTP